MMLEEGLSWLFEISSFKRNYSELNIFLTRFNTTYFPNQNVTSRRSIDIRILDQAHSGLEKCWKGSLPDVYDKRGPTIELIASSI